MHKPLPRHTPLAALLMLAACNGSARPPAEAPADNATSPMPASTPVPVPPQIANSTSTALTPADGLDRSPQGAVAVVEHYVALIRAGDHAAAAKLWHEGDAEGLLQKRIIAGLKAHPEAELSLGPPGESDGAAGSIYITVPGTVTYTDHGKTVRRTGVATLRRVNDVPGATDAQLHWRIVEAKFGDLGAD